jgi:hypothetical protein
MNPTIIPSKELKRGKKGHEKTIMFKKYATSLKPFPSLLAFYVF